MTILVQRTFLVAALIFAVMSYPPTMRADSKQTVAKTVAEAQAMLDKAGKLSRLTEKGSPSFAMHATIESGEGKQKATADFYLLWQDVEHWRAMAVKGDHREIHVRNPEGLWLPKIPDPELGAVFSYGSTFPFLRGLNSADDTVEGVRERKIKDTVLSCVLLHGPNRETESCFNPSSSLLERVSDRLRLVGDTSHFVGDDIRAKYSVAVVDTSVEYENYERTGEKWVPHEVRWIADGHIRHRFHLVKLTADAPATGELFSDPPDYDPWPYCERYSSAHLLRSVQLPESQRINGKDVAKPAEAVFLVIAPDGKVREVRLLKPTGRDAKQWIDLLAKQQYRPATCEGKPVSGYMFIPLGESVSH